jgi:hypothetical protein
MAKINIDLRTTGKRQRIPKRKTESKPCKPRQPKARVTAELPQGVQNAGGSWNTLRRADEIGTRTCDGAYSGGRVRQRSKAFDGLTGEELRQLVRRVADQLKSKNGSENTKE